MLEAKPGFIINCVNVLCYLFVIGKLLLKKPKKALRKKFLSNRKFNHTESKYGLSCTSYQSFKKFGARLGQREIFKTWIFFHFVSSNAISLHDFKLILCMRGCLEKLQYEIRKPIPKGPFTKLFTCTVYLQTKSIFNIGGHVEY